MFSSRISLQIISPLRGIAKYAFMALVLLAHISGAAADEPAPDLSREGLARDPGLARDNVGAEATDAEGYALKGADTCLKCHDKPPATIMLGTAHAVHGDSRTPFAAHACESCHGASSEHLKKPPEGQPRAAPAIVHTKSSRNTPQERIAVCLNCHQGGKRMNWKGSQHFAADMVCTDCHSLHNVRDRVLTKATQPEVCFKCHAEQRAQTLRPSHHPIREGQMTCSECHNPHGSPTQKLLVGATVNDTCYQCHPETRGPFLFDHPPAREDCTICHTPHGSTQANLLKVRVPFLCQECHMASNHSSTLYSNQTSVANQYLYGRACLNCHAQVHGSNHPSGPKLHR